MGTRADFYVGRGESAEWLGSVSWDGYPAGIDSPIFAAVTEDQYRESVAAFLRVEDGTLPELGWPWPWDDSKTTDYAYAFEGGSVFCSSFGHKWFQLNVDAENYGADEDDESDKSAVFPDMSERRNMPELGSQRSGVIVISGNS